MMHNPFSDPNFYPGGPAGPPGGPYAQGGPGGPPGPPMGPGPPGGPGPGSGPCAPPSQPLPSNVLGKGGDRMQDQQYMQQSSQIFVFSTEWANQSAQAVLNQEFPTIIGWHVNQAETKKQLADMRQKYPQLANSAMFDGPMGMPRAQMNKMKQKSIATLPSNSIIVTILF